jgi:hypothetical protein
VVRRQRKKQGFGFWGPFPSYSRRTRGGGQVRVAGCCLPLAVGLGAATALPPALLWRHARRR